VRGDETKNLYGNYWFKHRNLCSATLWSEASPQAKLGLQTSECSLSHGQWRDGGSHRMQKPPTTADENMLSRWFA